MKKIVMNLEVHDEKEKTKAMKIVSRLRGLVSISMEMKEKKMTVIGDVDPIHMTCKLRKFCTTNIISVEETKEEKKEEKNKEDPIENYFKYYNPFPTTYYYEQRPYEDPAGCVIC